MPECDVRFQRERTHVVILFLQKIEKSFSRGVSHSTFRMVFLGSSVTCTCFWLLMLNCAGVEDGGRAMNIWNTSDEMVITSHLPVIETMRCAEYFQF